MNFSLTDDQRALQEGARAFADAELAPFAAEWDATSHFPIETLSKAGEAGFMGLYVAEEHGGLGLPRLDSSIILEQLATGCISTTAYITIHNMVGWMISSFASDACREQWVPAMVSGEKLGSYCLTEPGSGSDAASLRTRAERERADYSLP
ncbi:MAG: acyl-CoA dehydrogenase family protein, partial [Cobetia crustatorum]